jgi:hypothetical protein
MITLLCLLGLVIWGGGCLLVPVGDDGGGHHDHDHWDHHDRWDH